MSKEALRTKIEPIRSYVMGLDLTSPTECRNALNLTFPISTLQPIKELCIQGIEEGWLCPRSAPHLKYGRLFKATPELPIGVDTVDMPGGHAACKGPGHEHPEGEIDLCFTLSGSPLFDGSPEGWTVYPPKSWHVPTVSNGRMIILYFLPNGAIRFGPPKN